MTLISPDKKLLISRLIENRRSEKSNCTETVEGNWVAEKLRNEVDDTLRPQFSLTDHIQTRNSVIFSDQVLSG